MSAPASRTMTAIQWWIVALVAATALIHIWLGFGFLDQGGQIFVLNGLGYLVLGTLYFLNIAPLVRYRSVIRWLLIAYTAMTVIAWVFIGTGSPFAGPILMGTQTFVAYLDKAIEIALIVLLWLDGQKQK